MLDNANQEKHPSFSSKQHNFHPRDIKNESSSIFEMKKIFLSHFYGCIMVHKGNNNDNHLRVA
jgi:hypothetical protein